MGANLTKVFIADIEATCWENAAAQGSQVSEIIEIGICALNPKTGVISDRTSYPVRPQFSTVSQFCTELTGWTAEELHFAPPLRDVLKQLDADFKFTKNHIWFTCGEYDRIKLFQLETLYGIAPAENPFFRLRAHVNIKTLFALKHKLKREIGLKRMLAMCNEEFEGRHHNGADDAYNIAKLVRHVLKE